MEKQVQQTLFDMLYALAARNGREQVLFGQSAPYARAAFARSMSCEAFPDVWFEVPLMGDPWFDLHLVTPKDALNPESVFSAEDTGGHPAMFEWFSKQAGVRQLVLGWDVGSGDTGVCAVQLLVGNRNPDVSCAFLHAAGRDDLQDAYRAFVGRIPDSWFPCYTGVFPNRERDFVRVECVVPSLQQRAYVHDRSLLAAHLRQAGVQKIDTSMLDRGQAFAASPFMIEYQFDVLPDGTLGTTHALSARFAPPAGKGDWPGFDPAGAAGELMERVEAWNLADKRWRLLADTAFAMRVERGDMAGLLFSYPTFVKLRWRDGEPLDAKAYLLAGLQSLPTSSSRSSKTAETH